MSQVYLYSGTDLPLNQSLPRLSLLDIIHPSHFYLAGHRGECGEKDVGEPDCGSTELSLF